MRLLATLAVGLFVLAAHTAAGRVAFRILDRLSLPDARWDYAAVDPQAHRLYLGRFGGVLALDLISGKLTPVLVPSALVHGVLPLGNGLVMSTNGQTDSVDLFDGNSGRIVARIPTGHEPDAIAFESQTGLAIVTDEASHELTLIDPVAHRAIGRIALPGKPEFVAPGRDGIVFDNIEDRNAVAVIDLKHRRVAGLLPLKGCSGPTGLAYDARTDLLLSVCRNGVAKFLRGRDGHELATIDVGTGPDAAILDAAHHLAFVPSGGSGTLSVISTERDRIRKLQSLPTQPGSRTATLDRTTGRIYIPAARFLPSRGPSERPQPVPGTFELLIVGPATPLQATHGPTPSQGVDHGTH